EASWKSFMDAHVLDTVLSQHFIDRVGLLLVIHPPAASVGPGRIELEAVNLQGLALIGKRFHGRMSVGRIHASQHPDPGGRHRPDLGGFAGRKQIDPVKGAPHSKAVQKGDIGLAFQEYVLHKHNAAHVRYAYWMSDDIGPGARERFEKR